MLFDFIAEQCYMSFGLATIASSRGFEKNLKIRKMTKIGGDRGNISKEDQTPLPTIFQSMRSVYKGLM